jgi:hypothetical protein
LIQRIDVLLIDDFPFPLLIVELDKRSSDWLSRFHDTGLRM